MKLRQALTIFALTMAFLFPAQRLNACMGAFAAGYGNLFAPGIIAASVGGAVCGAGAIGACISCCCAVGAGVSGHSSGACKGGITAWVLGGIAVLGGLALVPGIILLDETLTDFQFARLSESDRERLKLSESEVASFNDNLSYLNAALQKIGEYASPLTIEEALKVWANFKNDFSEISLEAIKVAEILSQDLLKTLIGEMCDHGHDVIDALHDSAMLASI